MSEEEEVKSTKIIKFSGSKDNWLFGARNSWQELQD